MRTICFYHNADLDGKCSAEIVRRALGDVELYGINYGDPFPWNEVEGADIVMVDFSLQPIEEMVKLYSIAKSLVWIDHHKSAIEEADKHLDDFDPPGLREVGKAACELCWEWFMPDRPIEYPVTLLGRYDVWDLQFGERNEVLPYQFGMRIDPTEPGAPVWDRVMEGEYEKELQAGRTILKYQAQQNKIYCSTCAFETELDGLNCIALNCALTNSQMFLSVWDREKYHAMLAFSWRKKGHWMVSLYSDREDVDVSEICKARGGGGHKGAAGFTCDELPFAITRMKTTNGKW